MLHYRSMPTYMAQTAPAALTPTVYESRLASLKTAAGCDWVVVYGDREHAADITFLSNFDPRFEEAILVLGATNHIIVGNEGLGYVPMLGTQFTVHLSQSLGLMGQDRTRFPRLSSVLHTIGVRAGQTVGVVGWKYLEPMEQDDDQPAYVPAMLLRAIQTAAGGEAKLRDITHCMSHPVHGLRAHNEAAQIASFAWGAQRAALAVDRIVRGVRPGMSEHQALALMQYEGDPMTCHPMMSGDPTQVLGLRSPSPRLLQMRDAVTTAIGFRGGLCCRAGVLADTVDSSYVTNYVEPYMQTQMLWYESLHLGMSGGEIHRRVMQRLAIAPFKPSLNPGHLGSIDEWSHTPIRPDSDDPIRSGQLIQCDIIPDNTPTGTALNCEDTVAIADATLRAELATLAPDLWQAIKARREYLRTAIGIILPEEVLPLSLANARYAPAWLQPDLVWVKE